MDAYRLIYSARLLLLSALLIIMPPSGAMEGCRDDQHAQFTVIKRGADIPLIETVCAVSGGKEKNYAASSGQIFQVAVDAGYQITLYPEPDFQGEAMTFTDVTPVHIKRIVRSYIVKGGP